MVFEKLDNKIAQKMNPVNEKLSTVQQAGQYQVRGQYEKAIELYKQALKEVDKKYIPRIYNEIAKTYEQWAQETKNDDLKIERLENSMENYNLAYINTKILRNVSPTIANAKNKKDEIKEQLAELHENIALELNEKLSHATVHKSKDLKKIKNELEIAIRYYADLGLNKKIKDIIIRKPGGKPYPAEIGIALVTATTDSVLSKKKEKINNGYLNPLNILAGYLPSRGSKEELTKAVSYIPGYEGQAAVYSNITRITGTQSERQVELTTKEFEDSIKTFERNQNNFEAVIDSTINYIATLGVLYKIKGINVYPSTQGILLTKLGDALDGIRMGGKVPDEEMNMFSAIRSIYSAKPKLTDDIEQNKQILRRVYEKHLV